MQNTSLDKRTFKTPFCKDYWRLAFAEMKNPRMLAFAALILALRIVLKPLKIQIAPDLTEGFEFIVNAFGAMIYGPVVSLLGGALSDMLGYLFYPAGPYFPPYMITEMAGSFVFALFLYRAEITVPRLLLSRFAICLLVNVLLSWPIHVWYYSVMLGKDYSLALIRVAKNVALFPLETILLTVVFRGLLPPFRKLGYVYSGTANLTLTKKHILLLCLLFVVGAAAAGGVAVWSYNTTSLSASYTSEQRLARNRAIEAYVLEKHPDLNAEETVCIIESAYPRAFSPAVVYTVAVYQADVSGAENPEELLTELESLSKSKAAKRPELTRLFTEEITLTENAQEPEKGRTQP